MNVTVGLIFTETLLGGCLTKSDDLSISLATPPPLPYEFHFLQSILWRGVGKGCQEGKLGIPFGLWDLRRV